MISVAEVEDSEYVYVPRSLGREHIESALFRTLREDITIESCRVTNLVASTRERVSHSGSTVLRLNLELRGHPPLDLVAKILSPDAVNIFKVDYCFVARFSEVLLSEWWGKQGLLQVPIIYDTRAERRTREFWVLREYLPRLGWDDAKPSGDRQFPSDFSTLARLFEHVAFLHAHSRKKIDELLALFPGDGVQPGRLCSPETLVQALRDALNDAAFLSAVGLTRDEGGVLQDCCAAIEARPVWVDGWDIVCTNRDYAPDNLGLRGVGQEEQLVTFDWGAAHLAPMEDDLDVLLGRLGHVEKTVQQRLLDRYFALYAAETGHYVDPERFQARMPWSRFLVTLSHVAEHMRSLRWMKWQTRSSYLIHLFVGLSVRNLRAVAPS